MIFFSCCCPIFPCVTEPLTMSSQVEGKSWVCSNTECFSVETVQVIYCKYHNHHTEYSNIILYGLFFPTLTNTGSKTCHKCCHKMESSRYQSAYEWGQVGSFSSSGAQKHNSDEILMLLRLQRQHFLCVANSQPVLFFTPSLVTAMQQCTCVTHL